MQALLDVYTIQREIGHLDNVRIGLVGDLANGRTARSLAYLLSMYEGVKLYFVAPEVVRMGDDIKDFLDSRDVTWEEADDLSQVIPGRPSPLGECGSMRSPCFLKRCQDPLRAQKGDDPFYVCHRISLQDVED